jgi:MFS transporter, ACS family, hexuronate transporter
MSRTWWPTTLMMALSLLSYLDRQVFAVLSPTILSATHMNATEYATAVSGFSIAYMICNPIWGSVLGRIGVRVGIVMAVVFWSLASVGHALVGGFIGFLFARILLGVGEGATFPAVMDTVSRTLPLESHGRGIALGYSGVSAASVIAPLLFIPVSRFWGWQSAFLLTGLFGCVWIAVWWFTTNLSKSALISTDLHWRLPNLLERRFWLLFTTYAMGALPLGPVMYLTPLYLKAIGYSQGQMIHVLWVPPLGWEAGSFFWGWLADRFSKNNPYPRLLFGTLALLSVPLAWVTRVHNSVIVIGLLTSGMFMAGGFLIVALRSCAMLYPKKDGGLVAGMGAGSWALLVAIILPVLGHWFDAKNYSIAFTTVAIVPPAGAIAWLLLTARVKSPTTDPLLN